MDVERVIDEVADGLRREARPERAENEKRYLKSDLEHWGVSVPSIRKVVERTLPEPPDHDDLVALIDRLWSRPVHEMRMAAVEIAQVHAAALALDDLPLVERMLREARSWAYVDVLAIHVAGPLLTRHPDEEDILDRWASDDDFWIRRSALLTHLGPLRKGAGDWDRFSRLADRMLEEKEFFIRKAIGWILRDTSRKRPDLVYEWILARAHRASGVTVREAVKRLTPDQAAEVNRRRAGR